MIFELMKTGFFNGFDITKNLLAELVETFPGRVPIIPGHEVRDWGWDGSTAFGHVESISLLGDTMPGKINLNREGQEAWDGGGYFNWSAGIRQDMVKDDDGTERKKWVLDHVALLGAYPPGIPGLKVEFSKKPDSELRQFAYYNDSLTHTGGVTVPMKKDEAKSPDWEAQFKAQQAQSEQLAKQLEEFKKEREEEKRSFAAAQRAEAKEAFSAVAFKIFKKEDVEKTLEKFSENISADDLRAFAALLSMDQREGLPTGTKIFGTQNKEGEIPVFKRKPQSNFGGMIGG